MNEQQGERRRAPGIGHPLSFFGVLLLCTLPVLLKQIQDVDVWWHILFGSEYLKNFAPPSFSEYFFTPTVQGLPSYLRYTFLGDVLLFLVYRTGGDVGLQLLMVAVVFSSIYLLLRPAGTRYTWGMLLLATAFVLGTYQMQLIRNSLFGLVFTALILWLFHQIRYQGRTWLLLLVPVVLGIWSCVHGSYLVGFVLAVLLLIGDILDDLVRNRKAGVRKVTLYLLSLVAALVCISIYNASFTKHYLVRTFFPDTQVEDSRQERGEIYLEHNRGVLGTIKHALNNTVFKTDSMTFPSADFASPFDKTRQIHVRVSLGFFLLGVVLLAFFIRPVRLSYVLPFCGLSLLGLGYVRATGFIPVVVLFLICSSLGTGQLVGNRFAMHRVVGSTTAMVLVGIWTLLVWGMALTGNLVPLTGLASHVFGTGRLVFYDQRMADHVLEEYGDARVFNTVESGGYYLLRWHPEKQVFITGCFPVHEEGFLLAFRRLIQGGDVGLLDRYGTDYALLPHKSRRIIDRFLDSREWVPVAVSSGAILLKRARSFLDLRMPVRFLVREGDLDFANRWIKIDIAQSFFRALMALVEQGRVQEARRLVRENPLVEGLMESETPWLLERLKPHLL